MTQADLDVIYIAGSGRSGSTLLSAVLGQVSDMVSIGEFKHVWLRGMLENQRCGCGEPFGACPFWRSVMAEAGVEISAETATAMRTSSLALDRLRYIPQLARPLDKHPNASTLQSYTEQLGKLYRAIRTQSGRSFIVDSSKDVSTPFLLRHVPGIRLHLIHLVRDSRAVAHSWQRKKRRPEITDRIAYMQTHSPLRSSAEWLYRSTIADLTPRLIPLASFTRLNYETFVTAPKQSLQQLLVKVGHSSSGDLPFTDDATVALSRAVHSVSGNPMRFEQTELKIRLDEAWRSKMPRQARLQTTLFTWPLLLRYKYAL